MLSTGAIFCNRGLRHLHEAICYLGSRLLPLPGLSVSERISPGKRVGGQDDEVYRRARSSSAYQDSTMANAYFQSSRHCFLPKAGSSIQEQRKVFLERLRAGIGQGCFSVGLPPVAHQQSLPQSRPGCPPPPRESSLPPGAHGTA